MGYVHVASHKTKQVELWQQGDVSYLLNAEPNSHASDFREGMALVLHQWGGALWMRHAFAMLSDKVRALMKVRARLWMRLLSMGLAAH